jgi:phage anti-repressor protein
MKKKMLCGVCILLFISGFACVAFASMGSQNFRISTSVISGGGAAMSSENFQMNSTLGQSSPLMPPDAPPGSENFGLSPGFWYTIVLSGERTVVMNLPEGWTMISLPVLPDSASIQEVFPESIVIYGFERGAGYVRVTDGEELEIGAGYWILLNEAKDFTMTGQPIHGYTLSVNEPGWNMIGGCTSEAKAISENCNIGVIYGFVQEGGYQRVQESENLQTGKGYWILLNNLVDQCDLTVGTPGSGL